MPKSSKKRKEKAADFAKAKLKLGKGKQAANNAIDTTFKARSIALPQQSIAVQKDAAAPTTKRKLTYDDLLAHLKHFNAAVRKVQDALQGLQELFEGHPDIIQPNLTRLIGACVRLVGDESPIVRKALLAFFRWLCHRVHSEHLVPHAPQILLYTTSAQTHIFPEIRIDAVRFLDLLLEVIPDQLVSGWTQSGETRSSHGSRVLDGYLGLLNAGSRYGDDEGPVQATSTASAMLSSASKEVVFHSLSTFLQHVTSRVPPSAPPSNQAFDSIPTWYFAPSFSSPSAYESFVEILHPTTSSLSAKYFTWTPEVRLDSYQDDFVGEYPIARQTSGVDDILQQLTDAGDDVARLSESDNYVDTTGVNTSRVTFLLSRTLQPILTATFLDCAPTVFSPSVGAPETEIRLVNSIGQITRCLYGTLLTEGALNDSLKAEVTSGLRGVLNHMAPYFPFGENRLVAQDLLTEQTFQDLNLMYCELSSLLTLASRVTKGVAKRGLILAKPRRGHNGDVAAPATLTKQAELVSAYIVRCLRGEVTSASNPMGQRLTPTTYTALLPSVWSLINDPSAESSPLVNALLDHAISTSSTSGLKKASINFIAQLLLLDTESRYHGAFRSRSGRPGYVKFQEWLLHLPKTLWELGNRNLSATEIIIRFLLRFLQRRSSLNNREVTTALSGRLAPFFLVHHKIRGEVPGPFSKLPSTSALRRLALDLAASLPGQDEALRNAVDKAVLGTDEMMYWQNLSVASAENHSG